MKKIIILVVAVIMLVASTAFCIDGVRLCISEHPSIKYKVEVSWINDPLPLVVWTGSEKDAAMEVYLQKAEYIMEKQRKEDERRIDAARTWREVR